MNVSRTNMDANRNMPPYVHFLPRYVIIAEDTINILFTYFDTSSGRPPESNMGYAVIDGIGVGCNWGYPKTFRNVPRTHPWYSPIATERYNEH